MQLARACLLLSVARAFTTVPSVARRTTILRAEAEESNVGTAVRNIAPWLLFVLVGTPTRSNHFSRQSRRHRAVTQPTGRPHTEPALRIPNYKECVAEKGHEACANLLPSRAASSEEASSSRRWRSRVDGATHRRFFQWLYEHGIDIAA